MVKVSVVVPIYNVSDYLDECLISIECQTLSDIQIICVNDGSTDDSLKIIQKHASKDSRYLVISKSNSGYGDSMNRGFEAAIGEYIGIVESDDYIEPDMYEKLYNAAKANDCDVVKSDYFEFTSTRKKNQRYMCTVNDNLYDTVINYKSAPNLFHYKMNTWTGVYKKSFIRNNVIKHNTTPGAAYQDNGFWFQTLSLADRIFFVKEAFYHYRQDNPNSSINSRTKVFCMCDEYEYIEHFLENNPLLKKDLFRIFLIKKYFNYMYTYKRISSEYKLCFLNRFSAEFKQPVTQGLLNKDNTDSHILGMLMRIVDNPEQFYYDDSVWVLQHELIQSELDLKKLKSNKGYRLLHYLRVIR